MSLPAREGAWEDVRLPFFRKSELVLLAWGGDELEGWPVCCLRLAFLDTVNRCGAEPVEPASVAGPCEVDETPLEDEELPPEDEELGPDVEEWFLPVRGREVEDV